jgi:formin-binding protein 1
MVRAFHSDLDILNSNGWAVRCLYNYDAQGSDELSVKEGELIEFTAGPSGGRNYGDGWWEG